MMRVRVRLGRGLGSIRLSTGFRSWPSVRLEGDEDGGWVAGDLRIHAGPQMRRPLAGRLAPVDALRSEAVSIDGPPETFELFARAFRVPLDDTLAPGPPPTDPPEERNPP